MKITIKASTVKKVKQFFINAGSKIRAGAVWLFKFVMRSIILGYRKLVRFLSNLPIRTLWIGLGSVCAVLTLILVLAITLPKRTAVADNTLVAEVYPDGTEYPDGDEEGDFSEEDGEPSTEGDFILPFEDVEEGDYDEGDFFGDDNPGNAENVLSADSFTEMKNGDDSEELANVQLRLMELGYMDSDEPTTHFGPLTQESVEALQRHNGLPESGVLDYVTYSTMMSADVKPFVMQLGDEGDSVESVQYRLYELGYITTKSNVTGTFGEKTEAAVKEFQSKNKLGSDGKVGDKTMQKLFSEKCVSNSYSVGDSNSIIKSVKEKLKKLGYYSGTVDSEFTKATATAIKKFQSQNDLTADGKLGPTTKDAILAKNAPSYVMQLGDSGSDVKKAQDRLVKLKYLRSSNATGYYGAKTVEAVSAFQERNKLHADGKAGQTTLNVLFSSNAKKAKTVSTSTKSSSSSSSSSSSGSSSSSSGSTKAISGTGIDKMISAAESKLGCTYVRGAKGPNTFDCSGFVYWCMKQAGVSVSYQTSIQWRTCSKFKRITSIGDCKRGDIMVFSGSTSAEGHVGIYLGSGKMIDASSSEGKVRYSSSVLSGSYWKNHFICAYRIW